MLWSFFRGLLTLIALFILCSLLVLGVKYIIYTIKQKNSCVKQEKVDQTKKQPVRKRAVRAIYVNPEEVDKIYVKKSS